MDRTGQDRKGLDSTEQGGDGKDRTGQDRKGLDNTEQGGDGKDRTGQAEMDRTGKTKNG